MITGIGHVAFVISNLGSGTIEKDMVDCKK